LIGVEARRPKGVAYDPKIVGKSGLLLRPIGADRELPLIEWCFYFNALR